MQSEKKAVLISHLKRNKLIRTVFYPYQNIKRSIRSKRYCRSEYGKQLTALKNEYDGERCFIIGNGPSLSASDLDKLKNEYTFAANRIFLMFDRTEWRPTFYCCVDPEVFMSIKDRLDSVKVRYKFYDVSCDPYDIIEENTFCVNSYSKYHIDRFKVDEPFISEHPERCLSNGLTVTFTSIQLAIYMGFKEIYLLGVDHNFSNPKNYHFEGDNSTLPPPDNLSSLTKAYAASEKFASEHNIKIYNATRGGKLETFERINFDKINFKQR